MFLKRNMSGSFRCVSTLKCLAGYTTDENGNCNDIDECELGTHECPAQAICRNIAGLTLDEFALNCTFSYRIFYLLMSKRV